jgi:hypothetical protein
MLTLIASVDSPAWDDPRDGGDGGAAAGADPKWGRLPAPLSPGPGPMSSAMRADVALAVIAPPLRGLLVGLIAPLRQFHLYFNALRCMGGGVCLRHHSFVS